MNNDNKGKVVVFKAGGSSLTNKSSYETLNKENIKSIIESISNKDKDNNLKYVLIHGAGSFGHFDAKKFNIKYGGNNNLQYGFATVRRSVTSLCHSIIAECINYNINGVALELFPTTIMANDSKKLIELGSLNHVIDMLNKGFLPILHGDAIFRENGQSTIISGDDIIDIVVEDLQSNGYECICVFLTDVAGIYDKNPNERDAKFIPRIEVKMNRKKEEKDEDHDDNDSDDNDDTDDKSVNNIFTFTTLKQDVTGGMEAKLSTAINIARNRKIPVYICQVNTKHSDQLLRYGMKPEICTVIDPVQE